MSTRAGEERSRLVDREAKEGSIERASPRSLNLVVVTKVGMQVARACYSKISEPRTIDALTAPMELGLFATRAPHNQGASDCKRPEAVP